MTSVSYGERSQAKKDLQLEANVCQSGDLYTTSPFQVRYGLASRKSSSARRKWGVNNMRHRLVTGSGF